MAPAKKPVNVVSLAKSVLGNDISIQEGRGLLKEKLKIICQGELAEIDSVDSAIATSIYSNVQERNTLDLIFKYGIGETMNYNMEVLSNRMAKSDTAVSCVQSKISKQTPLIGFKFDLDRLRLKTMNIGVPGKPGVIIDLYSVVIENYVIPDLTGEKIWKNFARSCISMIMLPSHIRMYTLSSKNKSEYYKLPSDLLNAIKAAIGLASHFNDERTRALYPSINTVVDSAITQLFYDSRKSQPGYSVADWQREAENDGWIAPGLHNDSMLDSSNDMGERARTKAVNLEKYIVIGEAQHMESENNDNVDARKEGVEIECPVSTLAPTPRRVIKNELSTPSNATRLVKKHKKDPMDGATPSTSRLTRQLLDISHEKVTVDQQHHENSQPRHPHYDFDSPPLGYYYPNDLNDISKM